MVWIQFFFSKTSYCTKFKEFSLPYYLSVASRRTVRFISFLRVLMSATWNENNLVHDLKSGRWVYFLLRNHHTTNAKTNYICYFSKCDKTFFFAFVFYFDNIYSGIYCDLLIRQNKMKKRKKICPLTFFTDSCIPLSSVCVFISMKEE